MERLPSIKWIVIKKSESLKNKGGRVGKQKQFRTDETNTVEKNWYLILRMLKCSDPLEEKHTGEKDWHDRLDDREGLVIHIGVWEHHLGKVWNQHWTSKQLEYHNSKQNKGLACRISRNKHMIEISPKVFVVGPTQARSYSTIMYKTVHMTYEVSPNQHNQGFFKAQRDHCKTTVDRRTTRRRTPISYHASAGKKKN